MSIVDVRDLVVVITGIVYIVVTLVLFVVAAVVLFFGTKALRALHDATQYKLTPALERALALSQAVRDRTAALPGAPGSRGGIAEIIGVASSLRSLEPPFEIKKRSWLPF